MEESRITLRFFAQAEEAEIESIGGWIQLWALVCAVRKSKSGDCE
jgi:hypothetical protein